MLDQTSHHFVPQGGIGVHHRLGVLVGAARPAFDQVTRDSERCARERQQRDIIGELVSGGTTLLLTTQYLDEADRLADRICVVDAGRVIAEGTSSELKARVGGERLEVTLEQGGGLEDAARVLERYAHADGSVRVDAERRYLVATVAGGAGLLAAVVRDLDAARVKVDELGLHRPTLDDVFLTLTGRAAEPDATGDGELRDEKEIA